MSIAQAASDLTLLLTASCSIPCLTFHAGEYGELLVGGEGGKLLEGEEPMAASEAEVVGLLEAVLQVRLGSVWAVVCSATENANLI